jgi:glutaconate CoA-transferase subunit A
MFHNKPMALVREIVRRRVRDLVVIAVPQGSIDVDLLVGAGCVREVRVPYLGFDHLGLAPSARRKRAEGSLAAWDCDETQLLAALEAAAKDLPSGTVKAGVGTDLPRTNPDLVETTDPITGEPVIAVAAFAPDFAILHASQSDVNGNLRYTGYSFGDRLIAEATKRQGGVVIASVEEIVPELLVASQPFSTVVAQLLVDGVVEAPFGAHPCSSHGDYAQDEPALSAYIKAARAGDDGLQGYLDTWVDGPSTHLEYLDRALVPSRIVELRRETHV